MAEINIENLIYDKREVGKTISSYFNLHITNILFSLVQNFYIFGVLN